MQRRGDLLLRRYAAVAMLMYIRVLFHGNVFSWLPSGGQFENGESSRSPFQDRALGVTRYVMLWPTAYVVLNLYLFVYAMLAISVKYEFQQHVNFSILVALFISLMLFIREARTQKKLVKHYFCQIVSAKSYFWLLAVTNII